MEEKGEEEGGQGEDGQAELVQEGGQQADVALAQLTRTCEIQKLFTDMARSNPYLAMKLQHRHRLGHHLGHLARPLLRLLAELLPEPLQSEHNLPVEQLHGGAELLPVGQAGVVEGGEVQVDAPHAAGQPEVQADEGVVESHQVPAQLQQDVQLVLQHCPDLDLLYHAQETGHQVLGSFVGVVDHRLDVVLVPGLWGHLPDAPEAGVEDGREEPGEAGHLPKAAALLLLHVLHQAVAVAQQADGQGHQLLPGPGLRPAHQLLHLLQELPHHFQHRGQDRILHLEDRHQLQQPLHQTADRLQLELVAGAGVLQDGLGGQQEVRGLLLHLGEGPELGSLQEGGVRGVLLAALGEQRVLGDWERRSESRDRNWESESELCERETILAWPRGDLKHRDSS